MAKTSWEQQEAAQEEIEMFFSLVRVDKVYLCYATLVLMLFVLYHS